MRYLGTVTYNGRNYQGFQRQPDAPSIQAELEKALSQIFNSEIKIFGAGRTDAKVHSRGQTFHFDLDQTIKDYSRLVYSLNCLLPKEIVITKLILVPLNFDARKSATKKEYRYFLINQAKEPFLNELVALSPMLLDLKIIEQQIKYFIGEHSFRNFTSKTTDKFNYVRTIYEARVEKQSHQNHELYCFTFIGNGFMRYQIRMMIGTLLAVSSGQEKEDYIPKRLDPKTKQITRHNANPSGLYLWEVFYD